MWISSLDCQLVGKVTNEQARQARRHPGADHERHIGVEGVRSSRASPRRRRVRHRSRWSGADVRAAPGRARRAGPVQARTAASTVSNVAEARAGGGCRPGRPRHRAAAAARCVRSASRRPRADQGDRFIVSDPGVRAGANRRVVAACRRSHGPAAPRRPPPRARPRTVLGGSASRAAGSLTGQGRGSSHHSAGPGPKANPRRGPRDVTGFVVGLTRIELVTSALSGQRSNRLSYSPGKSATLSADTGFHITVRRRPGSGRAPRTDPLLSSTPIADDLTGRVVRDQRDLGLGAAHDEASHRGRPGLDDLSRAP